MGKYVSGGYSPATFKPFGKVCPDTQATAWDARSEKCFKIFGLGIVIGPFSTGHQGGFEVFNKNIHMDATQRPVVTPLSLNSMVS